MMITMSSLRKKKQTFLKQFDQRTCRAMIFVHGEDFMVNEYVATQKLRSMGLLGGSW